jgi:hypothetical protein
MIVFWVSELGRNRENVRNNEKRAERLNNAGKMHQNSGKKHQNRPKAEKIFGHFL